MKTTYIVPTLALLSGLALTTIAAYYSILGLTVIFAGGLAGFIVMEVSKVVSTLWLHKHWHDDIKAIKYVLTTLVILLMLITSMGTFGYLSKMSLDKGSNVSVNSAKVVNLEASIQRETLYIEQNLKQIQVYSTTMDKLITDNPLKASRERRNLQNEIKKLSDDNKTHAEELNRLNEELLPFKTEVKKHEVEVGPLIYMTKLVYGEEYKLHMEQTLTWLIIAIVLVFDPLAIILLIASQQSYYLIRKNKKHHKEEVSQPTTEPVVEDSPVVDEEIVEEHPIEKEIVEEVAEVLEELPVVEEAHVEEPRIRRTKRGARSSQM